MQLKTANLLIGGTIAVLLIAPAIALVTSKGLTTTSIWILWFSGAGLMGLLSGFTTGASAATGTGSEFLKFISGGILVPLVGGIATLIHAPQTTTETSTYQGGQLASKATAVVESPVGAHLQPLAILGGFFLVYGICAMLGLYTGTAHKGSTNGGIKIPAIPTL